MVNLQKEKEATRRSLIPEQPSVEFKDREELEQEIIRVIIVRLLLVSYFIVKSFENFLLLIIH